MKSYYLAPETWDSSGYRDVYTQEQIDQLPEDWDAGTDDCDYIGEFETEADAIDAAKQNHVFAIEMRS